MPSQPAPASAGLASQIVRTNGEVRPPRSSTGLDYSSTGFERLLYDLFTDLPHHQNTQWLQRTRAADHGRDLSCERVTDTGAGAVRTERLIVQAKHWLSKSVGATDISDTVTNMALLTGPAVRILVFATSGAFTADAVNWVDRHNEQASAPYIELWPHSHLESLLAARPATAAAHGLR